MFCDGILLMRSEYFIILNVETKLKIRINFLQPGTKKAGAYATKEWVGNKANTKVIRFQEETGRESIIPRYCVALEGLTI